jgi:hypothetical protein
MIRSSEPPARAAPIAPRVIAAPVVPPAATSTRPAHRHRRVRARRAATTPAAD